MNLAAIAITADMITALGIAIPSILAAFASILTLLLARKNAVVTQKAAEDNAKTLELNEKIHTLVNSAHNASLLATKVSADLLASKEPSNLEYRRLANDAASAYAEHQRKQHLVDIGQKTS